MGSRVGLGVLRNCLEVGQSVWRRELGVDYQGFLVGRLGSDRGHLSHPLGPVDSKHLLLSHVYSYTPVLSSNPPLGPDPSGFALIFFQP